MNFEEKINELKIILPEAKAPVGSYVASKIIGKMLFISGQISISASGELIKGKIGKELKTEDGYEAAKRCGLSIISQVKKACNDDLSKIKSCVKLTGFVNSTEDFTEQPGRPTFLAFSIDEEPSLKPTTTLVAPESFKFNAWA